MSKKTVLLIFSILIIGGGILYKNMLEINNYSSSTGESPYKGVKLETSKSTYNKKDKSQKIDYKTSSFKNYSETNTCLLYTSDAADDIGQV